MKGGSAILPEADFMNSVRVRIVALLVGLATLLPSAAFARPHYFCRMMDRVMASPCCAAELHRRPVAARTNELRATDCCMRVGATRSDATPLARFDEGIVPVAALAARLPELDYSPPAVREVATPSSRARAPPPLGPPLYLAHCSLLI